MNINSVVPGSASQEAATPERILKIALTALKRADYVEVANQFNDHFTFVDHALKLEFRDKERLIDFFARTNAMFPDSERTDDIILSSATYAISQWTLTATKLEPFVGQRILRIPIRAEGVSIVKIADGRISQWSDYYDQIRSRRYNLTPWFTDSNSDCC
jgi:limonene-1,2-epoxide hydrolase